MFSSNQGKSPTHCLRNSIIILWGLFSFKHHAWRVPILLYGLVEAGLWVENHDPMAFEEHSHLQQSIFDPFVQFSRTTMVAIRMDDTFVFIPQSLLPSEAAVKKRLKYNEQHFVTSDFKALYIPCEGTGIFLSHMIYHDKKCQYKNFALQTTKIDLHIKLTP